MPLDPRVKRFLDALAAGKPQNALETTVEDRRRGLAELMKLAGPGAAVDRIEDRTVPGPDGALAPETVEMVSHDLVITRKIPGGRVRIMPVPPEEFLISQGARDLAHARFVGHRSRRTPPGAEAR